VISNTIILKSLSPAPRAGTLRSIKANQIAVSAITALTAGGSAAQVFTRSKNP
jgi:hypothetical protein